jgi:hypothetical protein
VAPLAADAPACCDSSGSGVAMFCCTLYAWLLQQGGLSRFPTTTTPVRRHIKMVMMRPQTSGRQQMQQRLQQVQSAPLHEALRNRRRREETKSRRSSGLRLMTW